jgi:hypothetical protein
MIAAPITETATAREGVVHHIRAVGTRFSARLSAPTSDDGCCTIQEYRIAHPQLSLPGAVKCRNTGCGSTKFNNLGLTASNDRRRIIRCTACGTKLYRAFVD